MNKNEIRNRIDGLNNFMLADSDKKLKLLCISSVYTYNKAIAIVDKNNNNNDWFSADYKSCFKTWDEVDAFIDGLCLGKNTKFKNEEIER